MTHILQSLCVTSSIYIKCTGQSSYLMPWHDARRINLFRTLQVWDFKGVQARRVDPTRHAQSAVKASLYQITFQDDKRKSNCVNPHVGQKFANKRRARRVTGVSKARPRPPRKSPSPKYRSGAKKLISPSNQSGAAELLLLLAPGFGRANKNTHAKDIVSNRSAGDEHVRHRRFRRNARLDKTSGAHCCSRTHKELPPPSPVNSNPPR